MRISDWSSDVCSSDLWCNRVGVPMKDDVLNHSISKTEQLARLLLDRIIDSDLRPGDSFGTEAEMLEQFKVSRPTLRESIRILANHGVDTLGPGTKAGVIINQPCVDLVAPAALEIGKEEGR